MSKLVSIVSRYACAALMILSANQAFASELPTPSGRTILAVSGNIENTNGDGVARFDRAMLESFGMVSFTTSTPWDEKPVTFEGVPMEALMNAVGGNGERIVAIALNDYSAEVPIEDFARHGVILALKRDGEYMSVRNKGPLFIIYPFDSDPELKNQKFYSRSVWQVARMEVK